MSEKNTNGSYIHGQWPTSLFFIGHFSHVLHLGFCISNFIANSLFNGKICFQLHSVHQTLSTTCENCLLYLVLPSFTQIL